MGKIKIEDLYCGEKYHIKNAVYEKSKRAQIDSCADGGRAWFEQEFIRQTLIAINKIQKNGDCISDEELGDAVTVSAVEKIIDDAYPVERELGIVLLSAMEDAEICSPACAYEILECVMIFVRYVDAITLQYMKHHILKSPSIAEIPDGWLRDAWEHLLILIERAIEERKN